MLGDDAPCSQYVAALSDGAMMSDCYGLRSRGHIDQDDSYIAQESHAGHAMIDGKLREWKLNKGMGIRPVICVNEEDIVSMP